MWRKSSFSEAGYCVEVGWWTSSHSGSTNCVQIMSHDAVLVRDSKIIDSPVLAFSPQAWQRFISQIKTMS